MTDNPVEAPSPSGKWEAVMLAGADPIAQYWDMYRSFTEDSEIGDGYVAAVDAMDNHEAGTCRDVVRKVIAMFSDDACPSADRQAALIDQAKRALEREV
jgi:hypothetical protein